MFHFVQITLIVSALSRGMQFVADPKKCEQHTQNTVYTIIFHLKYIWE